MRNSPKMLIFISLALIGLSACTSPPREEYSEPETLSLFEPLQLQNDTYEINIKKSLRQKGSGISRGKQALQYTSVDIAAVLNKTYNGTKILDLSKLPLKQWGSLDISLQAKQPNLNLDSILASHLQMMFDYVVDTTSALIKGQELYLVDPEQLQTYLSDSQNPKVSQSLQGLSLTCNNCKFTELLDFLNTKNIILSSQLNASTGRYLFQFDLDPANNQKPSASALNKYGIQLRDTSYQVPSYNFRLRQ